MKKKLLSVVLAGAMTVALAGCGGGSTPTTAAPTTAAETKAEAAETKAEEKKEEAPAPAGPTQEELLAEIRDLLKEKNASA